MGVGGGSCAEFLTCSLIDDCITVGASTELSAAVLESCRPVRFTYFIDIWTKDLSLSHVNALLGFDRTPRGSRDKGARGPLGRIRDRSVWRHEFSEKAFAALAEPGSRTRTRRLLGRLKTVRQELSEAQVVLNIAAFVLVSDIAPRTITIPRELLDLLQQAGASISVSIYHCSDPEHDAKRGRRNR